MSLSAATPGTAAVTSSTPVFSSQDTFFTTVGTDFSWTSSTVIPYSPSSSINNHMLTYEIPRLASPTCVNLDELAIAMVLKLEDSKGNEPPQDAMVSVTNMWPSSMFRAVRVYLNEVRLH